ncbi:N-acetylglucosamine-6-phosphate deacetylase [Facklamia miroungae]|uniref:N-acetylglucosamine-6-phosphate deacetylase n=1 Tax=Facklamia miroungae TaxID=120956 RepID=A0A1G7TTT0_9LACT|nr:N-acetylglucosamine-6-phosphate deacetylase [Facklamia miroungae]NKZ29944.1 N-acetylglucosamine-6-phosphate deacetylase [Facklamia miroungae]SDG37960.1 N-acetylglucosamine-6-phosphate deacetylase [Facklamia miroungae]
MSKYYKAKQIILEGSVAEAAYLEVRDNGSFGKIVDTLPSGSEAITDYQHLIIAPGLVDTHIHGFKGYDIMDNDPDGLRYISEKLLTCGVTSWLPTTLTDSVEKLNAVCSMIKEHYQSCQGAKVRGIFLEGPFFTEKYKGAQNPKYMSDPSIDVLNEWINLSGGLVNKIAIAPEREGVIPFIEYAKNHGVHTALAHSDASFEQAKAAVEAGANIFIHLYNGMSGLHHRNPGMVGAALSLKNVFAELIADGHHVHPAAIKVALKARGLEEMVLITDCMRAGGMEEGISRLGEFEVKVSEGAARLVNGGNLAGSILELIQAVQNLIKWDLVTIDQAIRMASLNPARSIGIQAECGSIRSDLAADFIVIDEEGGLKATFLDGQLRYQA